MIMMMMMMMMMMIIIIIIIIIQLRDQLTCVVRCTERAAVLLNCILQGLGSNLAVAPTILTGVYGFPQSLQANTKTVPQIRPLPLPSTSFLIHYSLSSSTSMLCSRVTSYASFGRRGL
jgi:hypothetical protein